MYLNPHGHLRGLPWYLMVLMLGPIGLLLVGLIPFWVAVKKSILDAKQPR
jgi:hypothetical protein